MKVLIPGALRSYTQRAQAEVDGATLGEALANLDMQYPGICFRVIDEQDRVRRNMRIFVNGAQVFELAHPLAAADEVVLVLALSGG